MSEPETRAPTSRLDWASGLMPMVLHELNNATQYLSMLHSVHTQDPGSGVLERSAADLGETAATVEELGLLMAILSTATGTDLLMERRSGRAVAVAMDMTTRALKKRGISLLLPEGLQVSGLVDSAQSWELPWAVAASFWVAATEVSAGSDLTATFDDRGWGASCGGGDRMTAHMELVSEVLPDISGEVTGASWSFKIPEGWIMAAAHQQ